MRHGTDLFRRSRVGAANILRVLTACVLLSRFPVCRNLGIEALPCIESFRFGEMGGAVRARFSFGLNLPPR